MVRSPWSVAKGASGLEDGASGTRLWAQNARKLRDYESEGRGSSPPDKANHERTIDRLERFKQFEQRTTENGLPTNNHLQR